MEQSPLFLIYWHIHVGNSIFIRNTKEIVFFYIFLELHFSTHIWLYQKFSDKTNYDNVKTNYLVLF